MKEFLKDLFSIIYNMVFLCGGDLFTRLVIQSNHDEFPKYYWIGVAVFFFTELLTKLEKDKE